MGRLFISGDAGRMSGHIFLGIIVIIMVFAPLLCGAAQQADPVEVTIKTSDQQLLIYQQNGYDIIEILAPRCAIKGPVGTPLLPVRLINIVLKDNLAVEEISAEIIGTIPLSGQYNIHPAQQERPLSDTSPAIFTEPNPDTYSLQTPLPGKIAEFAGVKTIRGYKIAMIKVYPVEYYPASKTALLHTEIKVTIKTSAKDYGLETSAVQSSYRDNSAARNAFTEYLKQTVINPEELTTQTVKTYTKIPTGAEGSENVLEETYTQADPDIVEYLVIGDQSMFSALQPLLDWKTQKGIPAHALDVNWIYSNYSGTSSQQKIKNCIRDYALNKGTVWVTLVGDNTIVPDYDCYVYVGTRTENNMPTDLYYSDIDDIDWDDDGDGRAAEVDEDTADLGPDVFVGRLPARNASQAQAMVNKILWYEKQPDSQFVSQMTLLGVELWNPTDAEYKSEYMYTDYIQPYWSGTKTRFYDSATDMAEGADYHVTSENMNQLLAQGSNFFHSATHGGTTSWSMETGGSYYSSTALSVLNDKPTNILTIACLSNAFDTAEPSLSEAFLRNPDGGAVSFIGCSRYGWGIATLSSHGTSFKYDRTFYEILFNAQPAGLENRIGAVYASMKEWWLGSCDYYSSMRWCQFGINLIGDPEMPLYTEGPYQFSPVYEPQIHTGTQLYTVDTGVADAKVCLYQPDRIYIYGLTDAQGIFTAQVAPQSGQFKLTITAPNYLPYEDEIEILFTSTGSIELDSDEYGPEDVITVTVLDADLAGTETCDIELTTDAGDIETLTLSEQQQNPGTFTAAVFTAPADPLPQSGLLEVQHGQTITATYNDANDINNQPAFATDTALISAGAAEIQYVTVQSVSADTAIITFSTDTETLATVRCATACGGPYDIEVTEDSYSLSHSIRLTGLSNQTQYFFIIEALDQNSNISTDDNEGVCYTFTTEVSNDFFTEFYTTDLDNDLDNMQLTLTPDGADFYSACLKPAQTFPVDPAQCAESGIEFDDQSLYFELTGGNTVGLYGIEYPGFYVCSNGFITFGQSDSDFSESIEDHFRIPRISALFDDMNPANGGEILYAQLVDKAVVTFVNVAEYNTQNTNSFQVEMFFDGRIRITWLDIQSPDGLAGVSPGTGVPTGFTESDLTEYPLSPEIGNINNDKIVNYLDLSLLAAKWNTQLCPTCLSADINGDDGVVDILDLLIICDNWLVEI